MTGEKSPNLSPHRNPLNKGGTLAADCSARPANRSNPATGAIPVEKSYEYPDKQYLHNYSSSTNYY